MRLLKLSNEEYIIINGNNAKYFSKPEKLVKYYKTLNMDLNNLLQVITSMEKNGHNAAEITENSYLTEKI